MSSIRIGAVRFSSIKFFMASAGDFPRVRWPRKSDKKLIY